MPPTIEESLSSRQAIVGIFTVIPDFEALIGKDHYPLV